MFAMAEHKLALVARATGVVGRRLAKYLHGLDDWDVVDLSRRVPVDGNDFPRIAVDLTKNERKQLRRSLG